ncbi:MAG: hypothetical protein JWO31_3104 [Phycisphaerales bacterium]|nr:hypothetical protein [Phycisphaerales bacterium]
MPLAAYLPAPAVASPFAGPSADADDGIELIELPDESADRWIHSGLLDAYASRGFDAGRRRGYQDALSAAWLAAEEVIASRGLGDVPPSVIRMLAAAVVDRLAVHAPPEQPGERTVEGGLGT